ncbi:hypothetical protein RvY_02274 [Ramazzottius varieornatus]|uniref:Uncharacterized protein n=1 Tax=Ramazzottius varieornatus TaxID=947166 RepID=A0A1D1UTQ8_RAMVA|nr:hypothetical protein RvY_02274 [Ramazzottius varieornatus]
MAPRTNNDAQTSHLNSKSMKPSTSTQARTGRALRSLSKCSWYDFKNRTRISTVVSRTFSLLICLALQGIHSIRHVEFTQQLRHRPLNVRGFIDRVSEVRAAPPRTVWA